MEQNLREEMEHEKKKWVTQIYYGPGHITIIHVQRQTQTQTHTLHTHTHTPHTRAHIRLAVNRLGRITGHKSKGASFIEGLSDLELSCAVGKAEQVRHTACAGCQTCEIFHWGINHSCMPWLQSSNLSLHNQQHRKIG